MSIHKILIANRGEIAVRITRTCREMGIASVAVYSDADRDALHVKSADEAMYLGPSEVAQSYLNIERLIEVAIAANADAIHPGYGFLSENAKFAARCQEAGIIFIGPNVHAIRSMGSKSNAKEIMRKYGVPVVPGYQGGDQSIATLKKEAIKVGFPLLLKAAAGGGGKGMRIVHQEATLENDILSAKREAQAAFGDDELIIEKYIASGRHIEFQIMADQHGTIVHLMERECTIQRRYQKIIEESPSPALSIELRDQMSQAAIAAARAIQYDNAGTVEFMFDDHTQTYYFLEVNTRLQVEHPVTEAITGLDIVRLQILVAEGKALPITQTDVHAHGYAIECRIYAEDPDNQFLPANGIIHHWEVPDGEGVRVDSGVRDNTQVSIFYDSMLAKIIVHANDRMEGIRKMKQVIEQSKCLGVVTNLGVLAQILAKDNFVKGQYNTHFLANEPLGHLTQKSKFLAHYFIAVTVFYWSNRQQERSVLKTLPSRWRNNADARSKTVYEYQNQEYLVEYTSNKAGLVCHYEGKDYTCRILEQEGKSIIIDIEGQVSKFVILKHKTTVYVHHTSLSNLEFTIKDRLPIPLKSKGSGGYEASMPSQVIEILVNIGQTVKEGDALIVTSSMKMENTLSAASDGKIEEIFVSKGQHVEKGALLIKMN